MNTSFKTVLLSACASLALIGCGGDSDAGDKSMAKAATSASPLDQTFKFADGEALDVDGFLTAVGMNEALIYDSADFDESIGATVVTNLRAAGDASPVTVGRMELYGVDAGVIETLTTGEAMDEMGDVFRKIRLFDVAGTMADGMEGSFSIEGLEIDALSLKAPGADASFETEGMEFAAMAQAMSLGGVAMKGLSLDMNSPETGAISLMTGDMRIGSYADGKFGGMSAKDLSYSIVQSDESIAVAAQAMGPAADVLLNSPLRNMLFPEKQDISVGSMSWDGMSMAGLLGYLAKGEDAPLTATDLLSVGGMEFLDMDVVINGKKAATTKRSTISPIEFVHFMPKAIDIVSEGNMLDLTAYAGDDYPEITQILTDNGLDNVTGDSTMNYLYSPENQTISLKADGDLKGLYGSALSFNVGNFDYSALMSGDDSAQGAAMGITIDDFSMQLDDEKFVDTAFAIAGNAMGQEPEELRQQAVGLISIGALQGGAISPRIPGYATALSTFLTEGGSLKIDLAPTEPASVGAIMAAGNGNPADVLELLNLNVTQSN